MLLASVGHRVVFSYTAYTRRCGADPGSRLDALADAMSIADVSEAVGGTAMAVFEKVISTGLARIARLGPVFFTENPYQRPKRDPRFGPTLCDYVWQSEAMISTRVGNINSLLFSAIAEDNDDQPADDEGETAAVQS